MPGCSLSSIKKKLETFPVKKTLASVAGDTLVGAALGSATGALGAHPSKLDAGLTALNGLAGGAALNFFLSLLSSTYNHFAKSAEEVKSQPVVEEPKKGWRESISHFTSSYFSKKTEAPAEQKSVLEQKESPQPINYSAIVKTTLVIIALGFSDSVLSNMLGDAMLKMPYTIQDTAKDAAIGSAILTGMIAFIAVAAACAPRLASGLVDCCDKIEEIICCDGNDDIEEQEPLSARVRNGMGMKK